MRAQRKEAAAQSASATTRPPVPMSVAQRQAVVLGPVSAEENQPVYADRSIPLPLPPVAVSQDRSVLQDRLVIQDRSQPISEDPPEAIRTLLETAKRKKRKKLAEGETVEEIVPRASSIGMQNYEKADAVQTRFVLDKDVLRQYIVIREVFGPPRSRKPHLPGVKNRE